MGGVAFVGLSMSLTSCEDVLGHWEKPAPNPVTPTPTPEVYAINEYKECSWDGTKVVSVKKSAASPTEIANDFSGTITSGWYTVTGDNVTIGSDLTTDGDLHLILCDGAKLTINGRLKFYTGGNLYIYGQAEGSGKLIVIKNGDNAISGSDKDLEIHGGDITATASTSGVSGGTGCQAKGINIYSGKLTATTSNGDVALYFVSGGFFDVYGGEVVAENNGSGTDKYAIKGASGCLTVYGGKVKATGGSSSKAINANIKSGTSGIKFYFSNDNTTWDGGTYFGTETATNSPYDKRYAKAE